MITFAPTSNADAYAAFIMSADYAALMSQLFCICPGVHHIINTYGIADSINADGSYNFTDGAVFADVPSDDLFAFVYGSASLDAAYDQVVRIAEAFAASLLQ